MDPFGVFSKTTLESSTKWVFNSSRKDSTFFWVLLEILFHGSKLKGEGDRERIIFYFRKKCEKKKENYENLLRVKIGLERERECEREDREMWGECLTLRLGTEGDILFCS